MPSASFQSLVARNPDNEMFRFSLGQALVQEEKPGEAIPHLQYCVGRKPDWMMAQILLGRSLVAVGRRAEENIALYLSVMSAAPTPALLDDCRCIAGVAAQLQD